MGEVGSRENRWLASCPEICHANQGSLGKRQVEQRRADGESRAQADLFYEQEGCDRPELVEREDEREHLAKLFAQALVVKAHRREQVQAQGNAHAGRDQHGAGEDCSPPWVAERVSDLLNVTQEKQGRQIEG